MQKYKRYKNWLKKIDPLEKNFINLSWKFVKPWIEVDHMANWIVKVSAYLKLLNHFLMILHKSLVSEMDNWWILSHGGDTFYFV